jgi:zearalenone synthase (nonreducing iterative type I polyketide synthase)
MVQCSGLQFHATSNATLGQLLSRKSKPSSQQNSGLLKVTSKEVSTPVPDKPTEPQEREERIENRPDTGVIQVLLQSISEETGIHMSELTDDTAVADLGVDSIMAIEVAAIVSNATNFDLLPSFLMEHPTIGDLRRAFATTSQATSSPELTLLSSGSNSPPEFSITSTSATGVFGDDSALKPSAVPSSPAIHGTDTVKANRKVDSIDDSSPAPNVRITLLHGRLASTNHEARTAPPLYIIVDGTGTIGSYIYIPAFIKSKMPFYGIDSPFLRCPTRLTVDVGIPGVAKLIVEALIKKQPEGVPFWIGGFSGGGMIEREVCRQLTTAGHIVDGLLLINMCSPRSTNVAALGDIGVGLVTTTAGQDDSGIWDVTDNTGIDLRSVFASVATYNPPPPPSDRLPAKRTAIIWTRKGLIERCEGSPKFMKLVTDQGISTEPYPGFMGDPKMGAVAWTLPHKTDADLGPNGWDRYVGNNPLCLSIEADHLDMPTPGYAQSLAEAMEQAFDYFREGI